MMTHSLEEATGLAFRFVIGRTNDKSKMSELRKEVAEYDDFMLLDIEEEYSKLPFKTLVLTLCIYQFWVPIVCFLELCSTNLCLYRLAFFKAAYSLFDSEFYVKADDDVYLRPGLPNFSHIICALYYHMLYSLYFHGFPPMQLFTTFFTIGQIAFHCFWQKNVHTLKLILDAWRRVQYLQTLSSNG